MEHTMQRVLSVFGLTLISLAMLSLAAATSAGDKKKDDKKDVGPIGKVELGPEHKVLESLVGAWEAKVKMFIDPKKPAMESTGTMTRKMVLGGNYLQESYQGDIFGT